MNLFKKGQRELTQETIKKMKICRIVATPMMFAYHLRSQISAMVRKGHELFLVSSPGPELDTIAHESGAKAYAIPIARSISPGSDLRSLWLLYRYFRRMKFDCIHSTTPKAGLLSAIAGFAARVPMRLHTFTGQPWLTASGLVSWILKTCDRFIVKLNTQCYADSESQRQLLIEEKIGSAEKIRVLGKGSLSGVDFNKFNLEKWVDQKWEIRKELGISPHSKIINFTGRVRMEKGIGELVSAFEKLLAERQDLFLLFVGPFEEEHGQIPLELKMRIENNNHIRILGNNDTPEKYLAASDLLCLPSYREGFGNVVIEAGAMGLPTVGTKVFGLVDSVLDKKTGILVPPMNIEALTEALRVLLENNELRKKMGEEAREYARFFDERIINDLALREYEA